MKKENYNTQIAEAIEKFLTEDDWHYTFDEKSGRFVFELTLKGKIKKLGFLIDVDEDGFIVLATSPLGVDEHDEKMLGTMAQFICLANCGLKCGSFDFDMEDGEIRYKQYVDCDGIVPSRNMIKNAIYCPAVMFRRYKFGIEDIILRNASAADAFKKCEEAKERSYSEYINTSASGELIDALLKRIDEKIAETEKELRVSAENQEESKDKLETLIELFNEGGNET